jgi:hypothetical protein
MARSEWRKAPADPDMDDLGYDPIDWEVIQPAGDAGQYLFLPEEEQLAEEAFVVADERAVCDLLSRR